MQIYYNSEAVQIYTHIEENSGAVQISYNSSEAPEDITSGSPIPNLELATGTLNPFSGTAFGAENTRK